MASLHAQGIVFHRGAGGWIEESRFTLTSQNPMSCMALSGDTAVFGDPSDPMGPSLQVGRVQVCVQGNHGAWSTQTVLRPQTTVSQPYFGTSVAIEGDTVVVGTSGDRTHVFTRNGSTWSLDARLVEIGSAVSIDGGVIVANERGARFANTYSRSNGVWSPHLRLEASTPGTAAFRSVANSGTTAIVGAPYDPSDPAFAGQLFVFDLEAQASAQSFGTATGSTAGLPQLTTTALPAFGSVGRLMVTEPLPTASFGVLAVGIGRARYPFFNGVLLVDSILAAHEFTLSAGSAVVEFVVPNLSDPAASAIPLTFQALQVDHGPVGVATPAGFTMTQGVEWRLGR
jgi:hypothetical protein